MLNVTFYLLLCWMSLSLVSWRHQFHQHMGLWVEQLLGRCHQCFWWQQHLVEKLPKNATQHFSCTLKYALKFLQKCWCNTQPFFWAIYFLLPPLGIAQIGWGMNTCGLYYKNILMISDNHSDAYIINVSLALASVVNYTHKWRQSLEHHLLMTLYSSFTTVKCL